MYSHNSRVYISTIIGVMLGAGTAFGQLISGFAGPQLGWRAPFLIISIPALFLSCLIWFIAEEPPRGQRERASDSLEDGSKPNYSEKFEYRKVLDLLSTPSVVLILLQGIPGCLPWGMIIVFLNDYFSSEGGLSVEAATGLMTLFSIGGGVGQVVGGVVGQHLSDRDPRLQCLLMSSSTLLGMLPLLHLVRFIHSDPNNHYHWAFLAGVLVTMTGPNVRAILQVVVPFSSIDYYYVFIPCICMTCCLK